MRWSKKKFSFSLIEFNIEISIYLFRFSILFFLILSSFLLIIYLDLIHDSRLSFEKWKERKFRKVWKFWQKVPYLTSLEEIEQRILNKSTFCEILLTESIFIRLSTRIYYEVFKNLAESVRKFPRSPSVVSICDRS